MSKDSSLIVCWGTTYIIVIGILVFAQSGKLCKRLGVVLTILGIIGFMFGVLSLYRIIKV